MNRQQQEVIEYLQTENQILKEKLGNKRILLNDDQRRRLAVKGKVLGRKRLEEFGTLFTPDTILRWHRMLVAKKWDYSDRKKKQPGRPRIRQVIIDLIVRFAKEDPTWGYERIQGALANVGYHISNTTVGNVLKQHGIEPAPDRKQRTSWSAFLKAHWDTPAAIAEFERVPRTVLPITKVRVLGQNDLLRRIDVAKRRSRMRFALSRRTQSSGLGQPHH